MLLISTLTLPPFFLSALGVKFSGRVRFGMSTQRTTSSILPLSENLEQPIQSSDVGQYMILTAERNSTYGRRNSERLNFRSFYAYLHLMVPDINDVFVFTLALTNLLAITTIFQHVKMSIPRIILKFLFTVAKFNGVLIILWIFVLGLLQFKAIIEIVNKLSSYWRFWCLSEIGSHFHGTILRLTQAPIVFIASYLTYLGVSTAFLQHIYPEWFPQSENDNESWVDWLTSYGLQHRDLLRWHYMQSSLRHPGMPLDATMDEERLIRLITHLNSMNLFVQPASVSPEYIHRLPTWSFGNDDETSEQTQHLCARCRCVKRLHMRNVAENFSHQPCRKCGFNGEFNCEPNLPFQSTDCPICLEAYQFGEIVCQLPCSHGFHKECIHGWLRRDQTQCPVCRWPAYKVKPKLI